MDQKIFINNIKLSDKLYFTVKEVVLNLKSLIEKSFPVLWIEGEISNLRYAQNGNIYFNLVEEDVVLKSMIFNSDKNSDMSFCLKNGLKVLGFGRLNFYPRSGDCFFIVKKIEPLGKGLLALKKEELIKKYKPFFDPNRKKSLPLYPKKIVIITSLFGAALKDFLKISYNRWDLEILIYPVRVQGEGAEKEITQAIKDINLYFKDVDIIVITRGGGSFEDLAPFYTEDIILSIKDSKIPVVSAVGHEIDYTICDLIADKRCSTPTAAAEEIVPDKNEVFKRLNIYKKKYQQLLEIIISTKEKKLYKYKITLAEKSPFKIVYNLEKQLKDYFHALVFKTEKFLLSKEKSLEEIKDRFKKKHPQEKIYLQQEKLNFLKNNLKAALNSFLESKQIKLVNFKKLLGSLSPLNILQRGYSIVKSYPDGKLIKAAQQVKEGQLLEIYFSKGKILVEVKKVEGYSEE